MDRDRKYAGKGNSINVLIMNPERKGIPGISDNNITMVIKEKCCGCVD
jgi:hypothetical protein